MTYLRRTVESAHAVPPNNIKRNLQKLQVHHLDLNFDGSDPITIINFLTEFSNTLDDLKLSELDDYLGHGKFVRGEAATHYRTAVQSSSGTGQAVSSWPKAKAFFLCKYATNTAIKDALEELRSLRQRSSETEKQFHTRFVNAHAREGSSWDMNKL